MIVAFACKNNLREVKESNNIQLEKEVVKEFIVKMNYKTNKEGSFTLSFNNIFIDEFQSKNISIIEKVMSSQNFESLTASFRDNSPNNFHINFGNKEEKEIETLNLFYRDYSLRITSADLETYFSFNRYIIQDTVTHKFHTKKIKKKHYPQSVFKKRQLTYS